MRKEYQQSQENPEDLTGKGHGRQGNDKAPGEETPTDLEDFVSHTQKGKNKVDGDPSRPEDQPVQP